MLEKKTADLHVPAARQLRMPPFREAELGLRFGCAHLDICDGQSCLSFKPRAFGALRLSDFLHLTWVIFLVDGVY